MLFLGLSAGQARPAEELPLEGTLPDPRSLHMPPAPVEEKLAMFAAADEATRIIASVHPNEARESLQRERSLMAEKAAVSVSLAEQITLHKAPNRNPVLEETSPPPETVSEKPRLPEPAPHKPRVSGPPPSVGHWESTAAIQQPPKQDAVKQPSSAEIQETLEASMNEISQWPGSRISRQSRYP